MPEIHAPPADPRRLSKAQEIIASGGVVRVAPDRWQVSSQSGSGHHIVSRMGANGTAGLACTCPDWLGRNDVEAGLPLSVCKHVLAVDLVVGAGNGHTQETANDRPTTGPHEGADEAVEALSEDAEEEVQEEIREVLSEMSADVALWQIAELEEGIEQIESLARKEASVIESWRASEVGRLHQRIQDLAGLLGGFIRNQQRKTLHLPHGELRLRAMPDRISINEAEFRLDREEFVRVIPEQRVPDLQKIKQHLKTTGEIPDGIEVHFQDAKFTYVTMRQKLQTQKKEVNELYGDPPQAQAAD